MTPITNAAVEKLIADLTHGSKMENESPNGLHTQSIATLRVLLTERDGAQIEAKIRYKAQMDEIKRNDSLRAQLATEREITTNLQWAIEQGNIVGALYEEEKQTSRDLRAQLAAVTQERDGAQHIQLQMLGERDYAIEKRKAAEATNTVLRTRLSEAGKVTPEMIAAAWKAFRGDRQGPLGSPGPAFREAIEAAFAARAFLTPPSNEGEG
jgi:phage FluMu protein gp41